MSKESGTTVPDTIALTVNGQTFTGWTSIRVTRGITQMAANFDIAVTEPRPSDVNAWKIMPFDTCTLSIGADRILTGYVDSYLPQMTPSSHAVRIGGRSKTLDLIDCTPDIKSGQFTGYTLVAIARSICALFGIDVVTETDAANYVVANTAIERCETGFTFLERLCRLAGVLACDDENGNLVLTRAGAQRATGRILAGTATISSSARAGSAVLAPGMAPAGLHGS
jgi:prophage tail gpP-like protein